MINAIVTPTMRSVNDGPMRELESVPSPRHRRECVWCSPHHVLDEGDPGAPTTSGMCPVAEARELAKLRESVARRRAVQAMEAELQRSMAAWFSCTDTEVLQRLFAAGLAAYQRHLEMRS